MLSKSSKHSVVVQGVKNAQGVTSRNRIRLMCARAIHTWDCRKLFKQCAAIGFVGVLIMCFDPPREGLLAAENVVWTRRKGMSFWVVWCSGMLGIGGSLCTIFAFHFAGIILGIPLLILMGIGFFFILRTFIVGRFTKYFLTNKRLLETRRGFIVKEIRLERFKGRSLSQFLVKSASYTENHQQIYTIKVTDPVSGEVLMKLGDLDENSMEAFERIAQVVKCRYCGSQSPANSLKCSHCGAPL